MEYFETKERLENLKQFRALYREYIDFTNRETNLPAQMIRQKLEPLSGMVVDSLKSIDLGRMVTKEAVSRGGYKTQINIIRAIFRPKIVRRYRLDDITPLDALDEGIAKYQAQLARCRLQLVNPFFWLYHLIGFIARLPLLIVHRSGYDTRRAERLSSVRTLQIFLQLALWYILLDSIGLIDRARLSFIPFFGFN